MNPHCKALLIGTTAALALGLAACNKPALQGAQLDHPAPGAAFAAAPLKEQVTAALNAEPGLAAINVEVNPADGTVTLTGTAYSEENKTKASEIALNVPGVMSVQNHLFVKDMT